MAKQGLVKVLGRGELTKALTVRAHGFSAEARRPSKRPAAASRSCPPPWGDRRPPARGNALTNR